MFNHEANSIAEAIGITEEQYNSFSEKLSKFSDQTDRPSVFAEYVESLTATEPINNRVVSALFFLLLRQSVDQDRMTETLADTSMYLDARVRVLEGSAEKVFLSSKELNEWSDKLVKMSKRMEMAMAQNLPKPVIDSIHNDRENIKNKMAFTMDELRRYHEEVARLQPGDDELRALLFNGWSERYPELKSHL